MTVDTYEIALRFLVIKYITYLFKNKRIGFKDALVSKVIE